MVGRPPKIPKELPPPPTPLVRQSEEDVLRINKLLGTPRPEPSLRRDLAAILGTPLAAKSAPAPAAPQEPQPEGCPKQAAEQVVEAITPAAPPQPTPPRVYPPQVFYDPSLVRFVHTGDRFKRSTPSQRPPGHFDPTGLG